MNSAQKPLVIYHAGCPDGVTAAWVVKKRFGDVDLHPGRYGEPPPDVTNRDVYVVDFSYPRAVLEQMYARAFCLHVFDHHASARKDLEDLGYCEFDLNRSGAGITWDRLFAGRERPLVVDYVEDRDLWRYALPKSREVNAYLALCSGSVEAVVSVSKTPLIDLVAKGGAILEYLSHYAEQVAATARECLFEGHRSAVVNAAYERRSEVLELLNNNGFDIAIGWNQDADGSFRYSLRTQRDDIDVSLLAKHYGGGGHKKAAGFETRELMKFPPWVGNEPLA